MLEAVSPELLQAGLQTLIGEVRGMRQELRDQTARLGNLEQATAGLRRYVADVHVTLANLSVRLDHLADRVQRLEARTGLLGAEQAS